jgi:alpha-mannosidase
MHDDRTLIERRIQRELHERLVPAMYARRAPMTVEAWHAPGEPVSFAEAMAATFQPIATGQPWGPPWSTMWLRCHADVPAGWVSASLEAVIDLGFGPRRLGDGFQAEGLVYDEAGNPVQGIHPRRTGVPLPDQPAGPMRLIVEAAANPPLGGNARPTPLGSPATAGDTPLYRLGEVSLCVRDDTVFGLLLDIEVLDELMRSLPLDDPRRQRLLRQLQDAFDAIDTTDVATTAAAARAVLRPALELPARASAHRIVAVGHAHIDSAWLWPLRETVRKCTRTFASATRLMDDYPDYHFVCSQAAQYEWIEQRHPQLFDRIRRRVQRNQWHPVGGMWVEPDMNLPSGESLVRQLVHGQRWFESRFGRRCTEVWIPDVFGYPASLPQIFAAAGCHRFVTQKLSWNQQNVFPHHTFLWRGIDGTEVLTHFPPVNTYNATVVSAEVRMAEANFREHGWSDWSLMPFGHGNGGGGPTREMVERARRMADLDGAPRVAMGTTDQFFVQVEAEIARGAAVPVWDGELYFEMHRGTLTSQLATKLGNRRCEQLLAEAELWWATSGGALPADVVERLDRMWKDLLLQQFHDILPGSSIAWVHDDAEAAFHRLSQMADSLITEAMQRLQPPALGVANPSAVARDEVMLIGGQPRRVQVPAFGIAPVDGSAEAAVDTVVTTDHTMANSRLAVSWDLDGRITSIIDVHRGRQLLPTGEAITLRLAADHPVQYDAWDVEQWTVAGGEPLGAPESVQLVRAHPLMAELAVTHRFGRDAASQVTLTYRLTAGSPRLDIDVDLHWREREQLLTLHVPVDVRAREARCDIQFGHVTRPTHSSTSWDAAKFEVCAHRYVDLAEPAFGVAVLNNGRYGHSLQQGGVQVSLARAAAFPDPEADTGHHRVTLAVLPHGAGLHEVLHHATALNVPLRVVHGDGTAVPPVLTVDHPGVQVSAVKRADDGSGALVVRLAEVCGDRSSVVLRARTRIAEAVRCNLLEEPSSVVDVTDGIIALTMRPFELITLRLSGV